MHRRNILAVGGATIAIVLAGAGAGAAFAASSPKVTVRVEGLKHTLLPPTVVHTHSGSITRFGAPSGKCPATSAAGALGVATHHKWVGTWESSFNDYEITSILGEAHPFTSKYYWSEWINDKYATTGACGIKLHAGDQLLFAVEGSKTKYPLAIEAPSSATVGRSFNVTVVWFNTKGKSKPRPGATVSVAGHSGKTDSHGVVPLTPSTAGTFILHASDPGYIRAAPVTLHVSG